MCEVLLRSLPFDSDGGHRLLPRVAFERRSLSFLRLAADVEVVALMSGADLAAVAQDSWLVHTEARTVPGPETGATTRACRPDGRCAAPGRGC